MSVPWRMAAAALLLLLLLTTLTLATHDWDPMAFVLERPTDIPAEQTWGVGYDGQQAYAIALSPCQPSNALDHAAYRYMRVVYPSMAFILSLGQPAVLPWSMLLVNLLSGAASAGLLAFLLERRKAPAWPALFVVLTFAYWIGVRLDLNEPLALCLALAGLAAHEKERRGLSIAAFVLAGLTKEAALVFPLAVAASECFRQRRWRPLGAGLVPLGTYILWAVFLQIWLGESPFGTRQSHLRLLPFAGFSALEGREARLMLVLWVILPAVVLGLLALYDLLVRRETSSVEAWLVLGNVALIASLPDLTWFDPLAVLRMSVGLMMTGALLLAVRWRRGLPFAAALWGPSLLVAFLLPGFIL